jgi:hypothetical protein
LFNAIQPSNNLTAYRDFYGNYHLSLHYPKYFSLFILAAFFLISCEKDDPTVIDPVLTFPQIDSAYLTPDVFDTSVVNCVATAVVTSPEPVRQVTAKVTNPIGEEQTIILRDDGSYPDPIASDGSYSGLITYNMSCRLVGFYNVKFQAENISGLFSPEINIGFQVRNSGNQPPTIWNLTVQPDSVRLNVSQIFSFRVNASDPNGSCDIIVGYTGRRPDNTSLTPRGLYDDGSCCIVENLGVSGDSIANDGVYTRILQGAPDQLGYYVYHIIAVDRSGDSSQVLSDSIYVYP